ncbi:hypothetical protein COLO4_01184, partial [Corchorus olitorius]
PADADSRVAAGQRRSGGADGDGDRAGCAAHQPGNRYAYAAVRSPSGDAGIYPAAYRLGAAGGAGGQSADDPAGARAAGYGDWRLLDAVNRHHHATGAGGA